MHINNFYLGQCVLCTNGRFAPDVWEWTNRVPIEEEIYTVSAVVRCPHRLTAEYGGGLRLVEIDTEMATTDAVPRLKRDISRFASLDVAEIETVYAVRTCH